jgi:hypothetical protein
MATATEPPDTFTGNGNANTIRGLGDDILNGLGGNNLLRGENDVQEPI